MTNEGFLRICMGKELTDILYMSLRDLQPSDLALGTKNDF